MMMVKPKNGSTNNKDRGDSEVGRSMIEVTKKRDQQSTMMEVTPKSATNDGELLPGWLLLYVFASVVVVVIVATGDPGGLYS
jgi:hypothetical protein